MSSTDIKWPCGWNVCPANSVDRVAMDSHTAAHPERWLAAFEFLKGTDLTQLPLGNHPIIGNEVYASVSEYQPKEHADCRFEAHREYVDLQYVISGQELIGKAPAQGLEVTTPYTPDIVFFGTEAPQAVYEEANPGNFFIFFPADAHRPSMKSADGVMVKKVVIKLKY